MMDHGNSLSQTQLHMAKSITKSLIASFSENDRVGSKKRHFVGSLTKLRNCTFFKKLFFSHGAIQNIQIQLVTKPCRLCPMGS